MTCQDAASVPPRAGGVVVSGLIYFRSYSVVPGGEAGLRAGVGGVALGFFGWADANGTVLNARGSAQQMQGLVAYQPGDWRTIFWDEVTQTWRVREGLGLTMVSASPGVWVRIPNGSSYGDAIFTNPLDGSISAAYSAGLEATPWRVARPDGPGGLSLITTWNPST